MDANDIERELQREIMTCPECLEDVNTLPAEGVPGQQLRACTKCEAFFWMDLNSTPRYE